MCEWIPVITWTSQSECACLHHAQCSQDRHIDKNSPTFWIADCRSYHMEISSCSSVQVLYCLVKIKITTKPHRFIRLWLHHANILLSVINSGFDSSNGSLCLMSHRLGSRVDFPSAHTILRSPSYILSFGVWISSMPIALLFSFHIRGLIRVCSVLMLPELNSTSGIVPRSWHQPSPLERKTCTEILFKSASVS